MKRIAFPEVVTSPLAERWPEGGLERVDACPVCNSVKCEVLYESLRDRVFFCAPGTWTLYRCRECGSAYLNPRPTTETLGLAYSRYFTHSDVDTEFRKLSALRRLRRVLGNGYRNAHFGTNLTPSTRLGVLVAWFFPGLRSALDGDGRHLPKPRPNASLLDVGCGNGAFLEIARAMTWEAIGLEVDPRAVELCRKRALPVMQGDISSLDDRAESYDVITMSHVIEHVHNPRNLLRSCLRLLKPGGVLWIDTPNLASRGHRSFGPHWRGLEPPRHLVLFTWDSLQTLITEVGFDTITPSPAQPLARVTFFASEAIARGKDPYTYSKKSPGTWLRARWADHEGKGNLLHREFVTLSATKPGTRQ